MTELSREEILQIASAFGIRYTSSGDLLNPNLERFATAIYEAGAKSERENLQTDGWRQCAKGQRTTQFCGQLEAAVAAERAVSDRLLEALKAVLGTRPGVSVERCHAIALAETTIAEVEDMRKEKPE